MVSPWLGSGGSGTGSTVPGSPSQCPPVFGSPSQPVCPPVPSSRVPPERPCPAHTSRSRRGQSRGSPGPGDSALPWSPVPGATADGSAGSAPGAPAGSEPRAQAAASQAQRRRRRRREGLRDPAAGVRSSPEPLPVWPEPLLPVGAAGPVLPVWGDSGRFRGGGGGGQGTSSLGGGQGARGVLPGLGAGARGWGRCLVRAEPPRAAVTDGRGRVPVRQAGGAGGTRRRRRLGQVSGGTGGDGHRQRGRGPGSGSGSGSGAAGLCPA